MVDAIEIYINNCDIVPRLSLASVAHLLACLRAVDELKLSLATQFDIMIGEPGPQFPKVTSLTILKVTGKKNELIKLCLGRGGCSECETRQLSISGGKL